jgi:SPOR domain
MADNNFRSYRGRDGGGPPRSQPDDPLAELARLIGQSEPAGNYNRDTRSGGAFDQPARDPSFDQPARDVDWVPEDRYAEPNEPAGDNYGARIDERYAAEPQADFLPAYRPGPPSYDDAAYETPAEPQYSPPARSFNGARGPALPERTRVRDEPRPRLRDEPQPSSPQYPSRQSPGFLTQSFDDRDYDDPDRQDAADQAYELEDYEEEVPAGRRRGGLVVVAAVLGLAVLGTAGAFAYRAMFGSSMLPSLPPIIKADAGPNKIVPAKPKSNPSDQAAADSTSGEKLVSREEQPVDVPTPANPAPRVVSTVPIFSDPNSGQAGVPRPAQDGAFPPPPVPATAPPPAQANNAPAQSAPSIWPPAPGGAPPAAGNAATQASGGILPTPRKIHTVIIHTDQSGAEAADASTPAPAPTPAAPASAPIRTVPARTAVQQARSAPAPRPDANGPLSIVPNQGGAAPAQPPIRTRTALARPAEPSPTEHAEAAPAAASGGYAVQVTSQRSEADAQAEFRSLRAKYPSQLGNREPIIRRADLGAKGVYYRALVGPFASGDQAAQLCSSLKAAGGSCLVQRD